MPQSFPSLCGSFAGRASQVGVRVHNAAYRALGLNFTYVAFSIRDAASAVAAMRSLAIRGCAVTMPFKETVIPLLDHLDSDAARIGAVNTIVNDEGVLTGYNTDWLAARQALEEVTTLEGKVAAVLGAGGAGRAVCYALSTAGCAVHVFNRTPARAAELAAAFELAGAHPLTDLPALAEYDILVNTTSAGYRDPAAAPIPDDWLHNLSGKVVMDIIPEPLETRLLAAARAAGATCVPGWRMRLLQAAAQFRLYIGREPPLEVMQEALLGG
jgi:shikimate dehydrogenase